MNKERLNNLIDMAAGRKPADLLIINCRVADVFNQVLMDGPLAIGEGKVVGWGQGYEGCETFDAQGGIVIPGLIDGHVHIESSSLTPAQFARIVLPAGTTTVVADPHEIANVSGLGGIRFMLEASRGLPLNVKFMLPSCVPATPFEQAGAVLKAEDLETLINDPDVLGLGEVMDYPGVINHTDLVMDKILMARKHRRVIDGHSPGVAGRDLTAYAASGIKTDHECVDEESMNDRLRLGQYVLMRLGSSANDLKNLIKGVTPANARRCVLCTDDREAADIISTGHINKLLRQCVADGVEPLLALTFGTLNAAECFGLRNKGAIAPGWDADLVIVKDLRDFEPAAVFCAGHLTAQNGAVTVDFENYLSPEVLDTVNLPPLTADSFRLPLESDNARVMEIVPNSVLTKGLVMKVKRDAQGNFDPALNPGLNKLAVIERHKASGQIGRGILAGYGLKNGAIAVTVSHDSHNLVVVGDNDADMLAAALDVKKIGGGYSVVRDGRVLVNLPLPVGGLMSDRPAAEVAEGLEKIITIARRDFGLPDTFHPLINLVFLALPVIPELKLTVSGLFDVTTFSPVDINVK